MTCCMLGAHIRLEHICIFSYLFGGAVTTVNKLPVSTWSSAFEPNNQMFPGGSTVQDFLHRARG